MEIDAEKIKNLETILNGEQIIKTVKEECRKLYVSVLCGMTALGTVTFIAGFLIGKYC